MQLSAHLLNLARDALSNFYGIRQQSLVDAFAWEFEAERIISFRVDQPGNAHHGSTLSYILPKSDALQRSCLHV